ncbi:MAG: AAA family ATPase [Melioribacteraceae bacterium]|nr:AAA family ATPase [Melioribacteraceae bacterium]MCF8355931.1 AAA family ATPase [Melioribacteraceae bacterium]MCF8395471.1 AAA family ATPase [Melioribacteraceae bacterium]MCF8420775.1 AAA family ATPase [Melioribacteraceae bacterium]
MARKCEKCGKKNREAAKYCKVCGSAISRVPTIGIDDLIGFESVKEEIKKLVNICKAMRSASDENEIRFNMHTIIVGNTGTGKSTLGKVLQKIFYDNKIITRQDVTIVDAVDYEEYSKDFQANIQKAKNGILFIDNVQKLVPEGYATDIHKLDKLFSEMDKFGNNPIVVLAGLPQGFEEFFKNNPSIKNRFEYKFKLPDFTAEELKKICERRLNENKLQLSEDADKLLLRVFKHALKTKDSSFGNGHYAVQIAEDIIKAYYYQMAFGEKDDKIVLEKHIEADVPEERSLDDILAELEEFIGMDNVKQAVRDIAKQISMQKEREQRGMGKSEKLGMHIVLTGNPGTGKTTIARKLGEVFAAIEFLDRGHVVETDRSNLVGQYTGQTPKLVTAACDDAMGGILFVDEAYALSPSVDSGSSDSYGQEAIETIMKRMEDDRDKFVVIAAGYKEEMDRFLNANPGMRSRFDKYLHIDDYKPDELFKIFKMFVKKRKYALSIDAEDKLEKAVKDVYDKRDKSFANGREMRKLFDTALSNQSKRISQVPADELTNDMISTITAEDIPYEPPKDMSVDDIFSELNQLTGMKNIKDEVRSLYDYLKVEKKRMEMGGKGGGLNLNFVFTGNPGTGKTTVARLMARIFKALGLLPKGHLIEVDRSKLVASYSGQTSKKTNQLVDSAMGGLLFIDEAYTLSQGSGDSFGKEAIDTLLKRIEDDRGKFISIVAGYIKEMEDFLDTNPGLASRFPKRIHFDDYKPDELHEIFNSMMNGRGLKLSDDAEKLSLQMFTELYDSRDKNFGNGRTVRNIFEQTLQKQSSRLIELGDDIDDAEIFNLILPEDIPYEPPKEMTLEEIYGELNELIGLHSVKDEIKGIASYIGAEKKRSEAGGEKSKLSLHFVFSGNPGTGKTTVARLMGNVFRTLGVLSKGHLIEADRSALVGEYVGQTGPKTNKLIDRAIGGILFIDEAYTLAPKDSSSDFGKEAIDTLLKRMEDDRGKFIVIVAGYTNEMADFLDTNPGLASRFTKHVVFEDYKPDELARIFQLNVRKKGMLLTPETEENIQQYLTEVYNGRDKNFGNGRTVRNIFEKTLQRQSSRIAELPDGSENNDYITILPDDIPFEKQKTLSVDEVLKDLNNLIGLSSIKQEVTNLVNYLRVEKKRAEFGGKETKLNIHFVFTGNPGTGKTTVARLIGNIFKALKLLPKGNVMEVDRAALVGTHIGQTAPKTNKVIERAMGGILFIDEAYTLSPKGTPNDFGKEAIDTILKKMEDDRGKFIVVVAGYTDNMKEFLDTNPGLASRFTKYIEFPDYNPEELTAIFKKFVESKGLALQAEAEDSLLELFNEMYTNRDKNFGNGRTVRNMFENVLQKQSNRLSGMQPDELTEDTLNMITKADLI